MAHAGARAQLSPLDCGPAGAWRGCAPTHAGADILHQSGPAACGCRAGSVSPWPQRLRVTPPTVGRGGCRRRLVAGAVVRPTTSARTPRRARAYLRCRWHQTAGRPRDLEGSGGADRARARCVPDRPLDAGRAAPVSPLRCQGVSIDDEALAPSIPTWRWGWKLVSREWGWGLSRLPGSRGVTPSACQLVSAIRRRTGQGEPPAATTARIAPYRPPPGGYREAALRAPHVAALTHVGAMRAWNI